MNNETLTQDKKGKNIFVWLFVIIFVTVGIIAGLFTNYKQETLICSKKQDKCYVEKTNLLNQKYNKTITKYSEIENITYMRQKVKGNRFAKGYTSFLLSFTLKNNNPVVIFSTDFYDRGELVEIIKNYNKQKSDSDDIIKIDRN